MVEDGTGGLLITKGYDKQKHTGRTSRFSKVGELQAPTMFYGCDMKGGLLSNGCYALMSDCW